MLALVHAAIEDPSDTSVRDANQHAADLLDELDPWALRPELRREVTQVTLALRALRHVLSTRPMKPGDWAAAASLNAPGCAPSAPRDGAPRERNSQS